MTETTDLRRAMTGMLKAESDDAIRLRFYELFADSEIYLALDKEPVGDEIAPTIINLDDKPFVLVFDRVEDVAAYKGGIAPYAAMSGRALAAMISGHDIGISVNPGLGETVLIPSDGIEWLTQTLASQPEEVHARISEIRPPVGVSETLLVSLDRKFAASVGLAKVAYLVAALYEDGSTGLLVICVDVVEGAEDALSNAVNEAVVFSDNGAGSIRLDIAMVDSQSPLVKRAGHIGVRFDIPRPKKAKIPGASPGMDPERPPKLR